jgi:hypothetical protein
VDNEDMQDWVADCNGEGRESTVRDSRDSGVVMMAVAVENGGSGQQRRRRTAIAVEDNGMQDWMAEYDKEGKEQVAREGGDSGLAMMAAVVEGDGGGRLWRRRMMTVADNKGGG